VVVGGERLLPPPPLTPYDASTTTWEDYQKRPLIMRKRLREGRITNGREGKHQLEVW